MIQRRRNGVETMNRTDMIRWIGYWDKSSKGPNLARVENLADMKICRMFNPCMQGGLFADIIDEQLWAALQEYRATDLVGSA